MSFTRDTIANSMQAVITMTRTYMAAKPQRITEAASCMETLRAMHEALMIFDNDLDEDMIAYLNMVD
jgi:hypothetical protein